MLCIILSVYPRGINSGALADNCFEGGADIIFSKKFLRSSDGGGAAPLKLKLVKGIFNSILFVEVFPFLLLLAFNNFIQNTNHKIKVKFHAFAHKKGK